MSEIPSARMSSAPPESTHDWRKREFRLAATNALKLGGSMIITWGIALVGRLYVPRYLGPERFGILNFADAFCATAFVVLGLGLDTYVRREISVRPKHASDFMGGVLALRLLLLAIVFFAVDLVLRATHRNEEVRLIVYIFGLAQFFMADSATTAGLLQAVGQVTGQSVLSIVAKIGWAICIFVTIYFRLGLWGFATAVAITEGAKAVTLFLMARHHLGFSMSINAKATRKVLWESMPFFISGLASTIYGRIGVSILAFMSNDREVGWFGAASALQGMSLMLVPIVSWVLIPLFARAAASSHDELYSVLRSSFALVMTGAVPLSLMMLVGADYWVPIAFGHAFTPAEPSLRVLAVATPLMYMSILAAYALAVINMSWRMTLVFVGGIVVSPTANLLLIHPLSAWLGPGGAGTAAAVAVLVTELGITVPLSIMLGRRCFDRWLTSRLLKTGLAATGVVLLDSLVLRRFGALRLLIDVAVYLAAVSLTGALNLREMIGWLRQARQTREASPSVPPPSVPPPSVPPTY